jgi:hypothetical protein
MIPLGINKTKKKTQILIPKNENSDSQNLKQVKLIGQQSNFQTLGKAYR